MKKILSYIFIALFVVACLIPTVGLAVNGGSGAAANQVLAVKPKLFNNDGNVNTGFLSDLAKYVNDRFFLRQEAVTAWASVNSDLLHSSVTDDVILGENGWLYFKPTLHDYCGTDAMTDQEIMDAALYLLRLQEYAEEHGAQFIFTVAPNKNSLYPENMPTLPKNDVASDTDRLYAVLDELGVNYIDMSEVFDAQSEVLYFATDSHWNGRGAALAADAILSAVGRESDYFNADFGEATHVGDLYEMLYPTGNGFETDYAYAKGFTFTASSNNADSITIRTENESGSGRLIMYRDSFGRNLYPYLAESFAEATFSRKNAYDPSDIQEGDVLVIELVERNLRYLLDNQVLEPNA